MNIIESIKTRHSTRSFVEERISSNELHEINSILSDIQPLQKEEIAWVIEKDDKKTGRFYAQVDNNWESYLSYGFQGEQIILKLTQLEYDTLWRALGGHKPAEILFGHGKRSIRGSITGLFTGKGNRKPLESFLMKEISELSPIAIECFNLCRLAPSGMNRQPWKFDEDKGNIVIEVTGKSSLNAVDFGIVISHAFLFLKEKGKEISLFFETDYKCIIKLEA